MMFKTYFTILMLSTYTALIGCGTPGPLYIPEQRYPMPQEKVDSLPMTDEAIDIQAATADSLPTEETIKA